MGAEPAEFDVDVAEEFEMEGGMNGGTDFAVEAVDSAPVAYELGEIGVDEMEPPSRAVEDALEPPAIAPPIIAQGVTEDMPSPAFGEASRSSPPPEGIFPSRDAKTARNGTTPITVRTQPPETRARAEEINSGLKIVPKIDEIIPEFLGVYTEIESWFSTFDGDIAAWLTQEQDDCGVMDVLRRCLRPDPNRTYATTSRLVHGAVTNTLEVLDDGSIWRFVSEQLPSTEFSVLTLLYVLLVVHCAQERPPLLDEGVPLTSALLNHVASLRWSIGFDDDSPEEVSTLLSRLFMLSRVAMLATFGNLQAFKDTTADVWRQYELEPPADGEQTDFASPLSYASFLHSVTKRYPTFVPAEDHVDVRAHHRHMDIRTKRPPDPQDPRELVSAGMNVVPYVPHSIVEACELFKSRVKATPQVLQMWEEQERAQHVDVPGTAAASNRTVDAVKDLYKSVMRVQKSFVQVVVEFGMQLGTDAPTPGVHAALATVWMLLRWYDVAHVLMGEFLGALLFDCQFHLMAHSFCSAHMNIVSTLTEPYAAGKFWCTITGPSTVDDGAPSPPDRGTQLLIENFNKYNLKTYTYLIGIVRLMVLNKTQRTLVVAELPVDPLKALFGVYEQELWAQLLQLLKLQVPFNGKRWRYSNMEVISAIYLYCPSKLDDDWLSGADVSQDVKDAPAQEHVLRTLIEAYNQRL